MSKIENVQYVEYVGNMDRAANKEICRRDMRFSTVANTSRKLLGKNGGHTYQFTFTTSRNGNCKVLAGFFIPTKLRKSKLTAKKFDEIKRKVIANYFQSLIDLNTSS